MVGCGNCISGGSIGAIIYALVCIVIERNKIHYGVFLLP